MENMNKKKSYLFKITFIGLSLIFLTHCENAKKTNTTVTSDFTSIYTNILSKNCVQCHEPQGSATSSGALIDFTSQSYAYSTLTSLNVTGSTTVGHCSGVPLVSAGNPAASYVLATLFTDYFHTDFYINGCTPYSPDAHAATLNASEKQALVEWIQNGAYNN